MSDNHPEQQATIDAPRAVRVKTTTGWADLAIQGAPGKDGYNGVDLVYHGAWQAGTYNDGDVVIGSDGIAYLCVMDATTTAPTPWGGTTLQQTGLPLPIVNGQWVKGVGGAAVWSPIIETDVRGLSVADTGWTTMSLLNGWGHYGAPFGPGRYRRLASGLVICGGLITAGAGSVGLTVFTFPAGYRTSTEQLIFHTAVSTPTVTESLRLEQGSGNLNPASTIAAGQWISLAGVQFYADA